VRPDFDICVFIAMVDIWSSMHGSLSGSYDSLFITDKTHHTSLTYDYCYCPISCSPSQIVLITWNDIFNQRAMVVCPVDHWPSYWYYVKAVCACCNGLYLKGVETISHEKVWCLVHLPVMLIFWYIL
jgi:hypothetical protein